MLACKLWGLVIGNYIGNHQMRKMEVEYQDDCQVTLKPPERALGDTVSPGPGSTAPRTPCHAPRDTPAPWLCRTRAHWRCGKPEVNSYHVQQWLHGMSQTFSGTEMHSWSATAWHFWVTTVPHCCSSTTSHCFSLWVWQGKIIKQETLNSCSKILFSL